jgi:ADP-ribose pyrophosphatase YjhB (NUDIX family)
MLKIKSKTICNVVFLEKGDRICLARKKKAIHHADGKLEISYKTWNGYGGKVEVNETVEESAIRELKEESNVDAMVEDLQLIGRIFFFWPDNSSLDECDMEVCFYKLNKYSNEPIETDESGAPEFFEIKNIPYEEMLPGDRIVLPKMLEESTAQNKILIGTLHMSDLSFEDIE